MNKVAKQIFIGLSVAIISAAALGMKSVYDEISSNSHHRISSDKTIRSIHDKLDTIIKNQTEMKSNISVLQVNQAHIMEGRFKVVD